MKYLNSIGITRFWNNIKSYVTSKIPTKVSELDNDLEFLTSVPDHDASKITSGTIDIARLPQGALERLAIVADETARFALTSSNVQVGDVVKQSDTDIMYMVVDESNLNNSAGYVEFTAGTATSVPWSGVSNKPETFTPSSHTHTVSEVTDFPSNLVTTNTNQNISGQKTFTSNSFYTSNVYHRSDSYDVGTTPASNVTVQHFFADKANKYTGLVRSVVYTSGRTGTELCSRNLIKNGALDATGSEVITRFNVEVQPNGDKTMYFDSSIRNDVLPFENNTYNLGSALNQWNNTYTNKLYLNGVEFGLGTANTWTGTNTFPSVTIKDTTALSNGDYGGVLAYRDNQGNRHGYIQTYKDTSGTVNLVVGSDNGNVQLNSNTIPYTNNTISLGSSTNQWNNTYTNKLYLNGTEFGVNKINTWAVAQNYKASLRFIHDSYETGTPLSDVFWESLTWGGMVNNSFERIVGINTAKRTNGFNDLSVRVYSQTGATLTGTVWETNADASSVSFRPILTDTNNLGTSLFQWNNTYTNKLYLNGTEFGLGTANVWTAQNTFSYGDAPIKIVNSKDATSPSATEMKDIRFYDVNNKIIGGVRHSLETDGTSKMNLYARSWTSDGEYNSSHGLVIINNRQTNVHEVKSESNFVPSGTNTHNLGSSTNQWLHLHVLNTHTDLVEPTMSNTGLVVRATDNTWENGSRIFLYSNTAPNQTYGTIYIDVDHGDGNNTKTALLLTPNEFVPGGGGTTGVSLGSSTHQWTKIYGQTYYYNGTEFSSKFMTTDTTQIISGIKKFTSTTVETTNRSISITDNPANTIVGNSFRFEDNDRFWGQFVPVWDTDGSFRIELGISNWTTSGTQGYWTVANRISKDFGTLDFYTSHSNSNLGTQTNKWKTINGLNPGALSLPQAGASTAISVDITEWYVQDPAYPDDPTELILDGTEHIVTALLPGWLRVTFPNVAGNYAYARQYQAGANMADEKIATGISEFTYLNFIFPIHDRLVVKIKAKEASVNIYPCMGNV